LVALGVSELTLVLCFGTGLLAAAPASVVAFFAGAAPNYVLNRTWVWRRQGRVEMRSELLPYLAISLATLALAALATSVAAHVAPGGDGARTAFVAAAYLATSMILFVTKFFAYQRFVFRSGEVPELSQETLTI
jgi:putative flippase GtrA